MENSKTENRKIILASASPRRAEIFSKHGASFEVLPSGADETIPIPLTPKQTVMYLSLLKARDVYEKHFLDQTSESTDAEGNNDILIVASDTIVEKDGEILGKPADKQEAYDMIKKLSGTSHRVLTGVCVLCPTEDGVITKCGCDISTVFFREVPEDELVEYINTPEPYDKAGAYAIQETFSKYTERYIGDIETIIEFPFALLERMLEKM